MEPPFLISLIFVQFKTNLAKRNFNFYHFNLLKFLPGTVSSREKAVKSKSEVMMTLNGVKRDNRKKRTHYSQYSSNFNKILFFILKI